jgi:hypothetical protein
MSSCFFQIYLEELRKARMMNISDNHTLTLEQEDYIIESGMENHREKVDEEKQDDKSE